MDWVNNTKDFLLLDGRQLAAKIRVKPEDERLWWEIGYLWFHDNFEMIIIIGGLVLLGLLIYNYLDAGTCNARQRKIITARQKGGLGANNQSSSSDNTNTGPSTTAENEIRAAAIKEATETAAAKAAAKAAKKSPNPASSNDNTDKPQEKEKGIIKQKADENRLKVKTFVKNIPGNTIGAATSKASAAWQSVKSGEALELGKEKFTDAIYNSKDFIRQNAKAGYALAFTTFMVIGFGLFFVPTLIMFIIGGITLAIFNKQKMAFLANT